MSTLGRLIWIGGRPDGDLLTPANLLQVAPQQPGRLLFHENLVLELGRIANFHKLMGIARIAVLAGKLAAAIWINGPGKGKIPAGVATIENRAYVQGKELDLMPAIHVFRLAGKLGDADQVRRWIHRI